MKDDVIVLILSFFVENEFMACYAQLNVVDSDSWPQILGKLSQQTTPDWKCIAYLVFGQNLVSSRFQLPSQPLEIGNHN